MRHLLNRRLATAATWNCVVQVITIGDETSGASASILPEFGMNCFEFTVPFGDQRVNVLWSEGGFAEGNCRASGSGIPILFPFPGRILHGEFDYKGTVYQLTDGDGMGNAIHGFVIDRPWRVIEQTASRVLAEFQLSLDAKELSDRWPADFLIRVDYEISGTKLISRFDCSNPDSRELPCGLGTHPYFTLPLIGNSAGDCQIKLPVSSQWELKDLIATGERIALPEAEQFQQGMKFSDTSFDNVFSGLSFDEDEQCRAYIIDQSEERSCQMVMSFNDVFRECVVYNPPHRESICVEPYTCVPDAHRLAVKGVDAGLRVLQPDESFQAEVVMELIGG